MFAQNTANPSIKPSSNLMSLKAFVSFVVAVFTTCFDVCFTA